MKKIPFTRLKVAQIEASELKTLHDGLIYNYCSDNRVFDRSDSEFPPETNDFLCHADVFAELDNQIGENDYGSVRHDLENLNKQFISFDYIMII